MVIGGFVIALVGVVLAITGLWLHGRNDDKESALSDNLTASAATTTTTQPQASGSSGLSTDQNSGQSAATQALGAQTSQQNTAASLLDPTTFSKYEQYKNNDKALFADIQVGTGAELAVNKNAAVVYKGWLTNGQVFDQSRANEKGELQPFVFTLGAHQVIAGWEQAMGGMKVGGTRLLIIPPAVGYGSTATGSIPPNSVLVFQVQLVAVQ